MAETSPTGWQKTFDVANVIGALAIIGGVVMTAVGWMLSWSGWALGASVMAILLGTAMAFARFVSVRADAPFQGIGEWKSGSYDSAKKHRSVSRTEPVDHRHTLLEELEKEYELKKLEP